MVKNGSTKTGQSAQQAKTEVAKKILPTITEEEIDSSDSPKQQAVGKIRTPKKKQIISIPDKAKPYFRAPKKPTSDLLHIVSESTTSANILAPYMVTAQGAIESWQRLANDYRAEQESSAIIMGATRMQPVMYIQLRHADECLEDTPKCTLVPLDAFGAMCSSLVERAECLV